MPGMDAQLERLVALEHDDGLGIEPRGQHRRHLPAAELETILEALDINPAVSTGPAREPAEQLAVHLGEAPQLEPPGQVVGVVDRAVVGAEDVPSPDRVVVLVDIFVASRAPAGVAEQQRGAVVDFAQDLVERFVDDEPAGRHRAFEELVLTVAVEPRDAGRMRPPGLVQHEELSEQPGEMVALLGAAPLLSQDDAGLPAHQSFPSSGSTTNPLNSPSE